MFNPFKKKSPLEKLKTEYQKCLKEAYILSTSNRKASDDKTAEANSLLEQIEILKSHSK